jgi:hypothetical protein
MIQSLEANVSVSRVSLAMIAALLSAAPQAATFSNLAFGSDGDIGLFGTMYTTTYGQTFTVSSDSVLESWTFYGTTGTGSGSPDNLYFGVARWHDASSRAFSGQYAALGTLSNDTTAYQPLTFNNINVPLIGGNTYIAYVTVAGVPANAVNGASFMGSSGDGGLGGSFFYDTRVGVDPLFGGATPWSGYQIGDPRNVDANMQFSATITPRVVSASPQ